MVNIGTGFDRQYATCRGDCFRLIPRDELNKGGLCKDCRTKKTFNGEVIVAKAEDRALRTAAQNILAQMGRNRREVVAPEVVESLMKELGGASSFGSIIASEIKKSRGEIDPANIGHYKPSQQLTHKLLELSSRIMLTTDAMKEDIGLGSMTEDELVNTLRGLAIELARTNQEFGRIVALEAVKQNPGLIRELQVAAGDFIDGEVVKSAGEAVESTPATPNQSTQNPVPPIAHLGMDEDEAFSESDD